ncbi:MAG: hypothetical protein HY712_06005 [candidate division NC10 bacterium]|nr:hypothetical protein [candidate division NC10 bacterium]
MPELTMEGLTQRLERLERAQRRWWLVSVAMLFLIIAAAALSYALSKTVTVEAENFTLKDANGRLSDKDGKVIWKIP